MLTTTPSPWLWYYTGLLSDQNGSFGIITDLSIPYLIKWLDASVAGLGEL
jgi:hypothetical protein